MDITKAIHEYTIWHDVSGHSRKTIAWYEWMLGKFATWLAEHSHSQQVEQITVADARAFLQAEAQRTTIRRGTTAERAGTLSDRTIHGYARVLRAFFRWLADEEYLDRNPMLKLKAPKLVQRQKEIVDADEVGRLLSLCDQRTFLGARMYAMVALLYDSGLRVGELVGLDTDDIDWTLYQVRVLGKGRKQRLVPFSPATHKALRKYAKLRADVVEGNTNAFFVSIKGTRVEANPTTQGLKRLGKKAGIPRLHPHLLRHSMAVSAIMNGANQFEIKRILGHTQLSTTDGYMDYAQQHLAQQHKRFSPMAKVDDGRTAKKPNGNRP